MGRKGKRERDWGDRLARFSPSPLPFPFLRLPRRLVVGAPFNVGSYTCHWTQALGFTDPLLHVVLLCTCLLIYEIAVGIEILTD